MYAILSLKGAVVGHSVGDFFLPTHVSHMYFDDVSSAERIYGDVLNEVIVARTAGVVLKAMPVRASKYELFVAQCDLDGVKLHDVVFVPCKFDDFDLWRVNPIWRLDGLYCYKCMSYMTCLGYLLVDKSVFTNKSLKIAMIQAEKCGAGYGTRIVTELKSRGISLSGIATTDAASFWEKQGAVLQEFNRFQI